MTSSSRLGFGFVVFRPVDLDDVTLWESPEAQRAELDALVRGVLEPAGWTVAALMTVTHPAKFPLLCGDHNALIRFDEMYDRTPDVIDVRAVDEYEQEDDPYYGETSSRYEDRRNR